MCTEWCDTQVISNQYTKESNEITQVVINVHLNTFVGRIIENEK